MLSPEFAIKSCFALLYHTSKCGELNPEAINVFTAGTKNCFGIAAKPPKA
jgi:hypothetical protein